MGDNRRTGWWSTRTPGKPDVPSPDAPHRPPWRPMRRTLAAIIALSALLVVAVFAVVALYAGVGETAPGSQGVQRDLLRLLDTQTEAEIARRAYLGRPQERTLSAYVRAEERVAGLLVDIETGLRVLPADAAATNELRRFIEEGRRQVDGALRLGRGDPDRLLAHLRDNPPMDRQGLHSVIAALQRDQAALLDRAAARQQAARGLLFGVACGLAALLLAAIVVGLRRSTRPLDEGDDGRELRRLTDGLWLALADARDKGEALARAQARYGHLFNLVDEGVVVSQDDRVAVANEALGRMLGYAPADMIGMPLERFIAPQDLDIVQSRYRHRLHGEDAPAAYSFGLVRADGTQVRCLMRAVLVEHEGRPAVLGALTDLSAIERATQELAAKGRLLEVTFAAMSQGISVVDADLRFRGGNDRMPGILDVPAALFDEGSGFIEVARYCARRGDYGPGDPEVLAIERTQFLRSSEDGMTLERVTSDGRIFDARHAKLPDGGWVITYADVTRERRNTRALAESEERLRQVMENAADVIVLVNEDGIVESVNNAARRIFGYAPEEIVGRDVIMLMSEEEALRHAAFLQRHIRNDEPPLVNMAREMQGRHKDGRLLPLEVSSGEFRTSSGERMFVGLVRDLTERKAIEARLRQSQKLEALGQLTGGVAHDFNNLLAAIMSGVEQAMEDMEPGSEAHACCEIVLQATDRATDLTRRLMAFSRRQELAPVRVEPAAVIRQLSGLLRSSVPLGIELTVDVQPDAAACVVDRTQLETALLNLVLNARDAIEGPGRIAVAVENRTIDAQQAMGNPALKAGRWVAIAVTDTGAGMPSDIRHRIFEPFFTTKEPGKGTGLGLSLVHGFVLQSEGFLEVDSEPGRGTTIRMHFPMAGPAMLRNLAA